jgi:hypothetical protein
MNTRDPLRAALADLPREVMPRRDLWPGIAARLDAPAAATRISSRTELQPRRLWPLRPLWLAAAGLATAALVLVILSRPPHQTDFSSRPAATLAALDRDYDLVRTDVLAVLALRCEQDALTGCADLRGGLDDLDHSMQELRQALRALPADSAAARWLAVQFQRQLSQTRGLANLTLL